VESANYRCRFQSSASVDRANRDSGMNAKMLKSKIGLEIGTPPSWSGVTSTRWRLKSKIGFEIGIPPVGNTSNTLAKAQAERASQITKRLPTVDQVISPWRKAAQNVTIATAPLRIAALTTR